MVLELKMEIAFKAEQRQKRNDETQAAIHGPLVRFEDDKETRWPRTL